MADFRLGILIEARDAAKAKQDIAGVRQEATALGQVQLSPIVLSAKDDASPTIQKVESESQQIASPPPVTLTAADQASPTIARVEAEAKGIASPPPVNLTAQDNATPVIERVDAGIHSISSPPPTELTAQDKATPTVDQVAASYAKLGIPVQTELTAQDNASATAAQVAAAYDKLGIPRETELAAKDNASPTIQKVDQEIKGLATPKPIGLEADDNVTPTADRARAAVLALRDKLVRLLVVNEISPAAQKAAIDLERLDAIAGQLAGGLQGVFQLAGAAGVAAAAAGIADLAQAGAQFERLRASFEGTAASIGSSGGQLLASMQQVSRGLISDSDLILAANRAIELGVAKSTSDLTTLLAVAAERAQGSGQTIAEAFGFIVTGIGRGSPEILDNINILLDSEKVFDDYAASIGKSADELNKAEKTQATFNAVVASTPGAVAAAASALASQGAAVLDAAGHFERLAASWQNLKDTVGEALIGAGIIETIDTFNQAVEDSIRQIETLGIAWKALKEGDFGALADLRLGGIEQFAQNKLFEVGQELTEKKKALDEAITRFQDEAIKGGDVSAVGAEMQALNTEVGNLAQEYNNLAEQAGAPLIDTAALAQGEIAFVKVGEAAKQAGADVEDLGAKFDEQIAKLSQGVELNIFGAAGDVADVLGDTTAFQKAQEGAKQVAAQIADLQAQVDSGSISVEEFNFRVAAIKDSADDFAEGITQAAQDTQAFADAVSGRSGAAFQVFVAAALAAGASVEEVTARMRELKAELGGIGSAVSGAIGGLATQLAGQVERGLITSAQAADQMAAAESRATVITNELANSQANAGLSAGQQALHQAELVGTLDDTADATDQADRDAKKYATTLERDAKRAAKEAAKEFDNLKSKVSGVLSDALGSGTAGVDFDKITRSADSLEQSLHSVGDINIEDDLKKLGDVAAKGFSSAFVGDVKNKFPEQFKGALDEATLKATAGGVAAQFQLLPREDDVAENARRLADIAVNGFKNQNWLPEFKAEVPDIFKQLEESSDPQGTAARLMKKFQAGLVPELIDKEAAKERVRQMILGDAKMDELAQEIAEELSAELGAQGGDQAGIEIKAKAVLSGQPEDQLQAQQTEVTVTPKIDGAALGKSFGASAAQAVRDGDVGGQMTSALAAQLNAEANLKKVAGAGDAQGKVFGKSFLDSAISNISEAFIDAVAGLVTGRVQAGLAQQASLTGAR